MPPGRARRAGPGVPAPGEGPAPAGDAAASGPAPGGGVDGGKGRPTRSRPAKRRPIRRRVARLGSPGRRLRFGTVVVLVLFTVIGGRLVQLQLTDAPALAERALHQRLQTVPLPAARGSIVDRNGQVFAHSVEARYVFADPTMIKDAAKTADRLSGVLGVPRSTLEKDMRKQKLPNGSPNRFVYLARGVDIGIGDQVEAMDIPGIGVRADERRDVPGHDLAANIIGVTGWDLSGLTGLESKYNGLLRGVDGKRQYEASRTGEEIPDGFHREVAPKPGGSVRLTLDRDIQFEAQRALYRKLHPLQSDMGAAVVLDVKTGEVLAQASYPTYDAANFADSTKAQRTDYASQAVVEPGSVEKAITLGAALQCRVITPSSTVHVGPTITVADTTYADTTPLDDVDITLPGIFAYSSNVGTIKIANKLGAQRLYEYQRRFGLGNETGEGVPGEAGGIVRPAKDWQGSDHGSIPIGLGIAVTPIQLAAAYGAIANDGEYVQPHLIADTVSPDGTKSTPGVAKHRVLSPSIAAAERKAMVAVTTAPGATGLSGAVDGYQIAAKTGTGQRVVNGSYQKGNIESFIGMAPADHPRYVVAVVAHTSGTGEGANMGPVFQDLMRFTLGHEKVPPTDAKTPSFTLYHK
ncbi:peptidoglycan D,D-transpeptidase FtsI family protein [Actinocatenispora sera]|uniref:peptidoglycan D,D-transpeptidase FtsI family protein n=1 Tax=Actinocatenispora sera TaxID=390989 RepID=UPI001BB43351|nr:penicillin-binding protein 2 [Actinocatenispora sera]